MNRVIKDIYEAIPDRNKRDQQHRKRAVLSVVGDLMHSLFGVPAQADVDILNANVLKLTETITHDLGIMKKTTTDLSNFATATTKRLDSLVTEIHEKAIQNLQLIRSVVQQQIRITDFLNNITLY